MADINLVALIVLLNDQEENMAALAGEPVAWGGWRGLATVVMLVGALLLLALG